MAGTGKSTISRTIAADLASKNLLGGSYFSQKTVKSGLWLCIGIS